MKTLNLYKRYCKYSKILFGIFFMSMLVCCNKENNCDTDKPLDNDGKQFSVEAYFNFPENQNKKYPDVGAKVYIYYDIPTSVFLDTDYLGNGIYDKRGKIIEPDDSYTIDGDGRMDIEYLNYKKDITIIVESNKMKPVNSYHQYSSINPPTKIVVVFTLVGLN